jgi:hypothetical protein
VLVRLSRAALASLCLAAALAGPASAQVVSEIPRTPYLQWAPEPPGPDYAWIGGHWTWSGARYAWVVGHYARRPSPLARWVEGYWQRLGAGWEFVEGHWQLQAEPEGAAWNPAFEGDFDGGPAC